MYTRKHYYGLFLEARERVGALDIRGMARDAGFKVAESGAGEVDITFDSLGKRYRLALPEVDILNERGGVMPLIMRVVALHYLLNAGPFNLTGELVSLRKFPDLESYGPTIKWRSEDVLARTFGDSPGKFAEAAAAAGGVALDIGDAAARVYPLPMLPMTIVINGGDEEFPPEATVMYDRSAPKFLHPEDLVALAELVSRKLSNIYRLSL